MMSKDRYPPFSMWRILFCFVDKYTSSQIRKYATAYFSCHEIFSQCTQSRIINGTIFCSLAITLAGFYSRALFDELEQEIHKILLFLA